MSISPDQIGNFAGAAVGIVMVGMKGMLIIVAVAAILGFGRRVTR